MVVGIHASDTISHLGIVDDIQATFLVIHSLPDPWVPFHLLMTGLGPGGPPSQAVNPLCGIPTPSGLLFTCIPSGKFSLHPSLPCPTIYLPQFPIPTE